MNKKNIKRLQKAKAFVFDMDGTLVLGNKLNKSLQPLPGAVEFLHYLHEQDIPFVVFTNGTVRTARQYVPMLKKAGFPMHENRMMTPSNTAADYFVRRKYQRVLVLGCEGVWKPITNAGVEVVLPSAKQSEQIDAVFLGWYREFTMDDLEIACHAVWQGAKLYTASLASFFATAQGKSIGTSGAMAAMIKNVTGRSAKVLGKPSLESLRYASRRLGVAVSDIAVVGDDPALEIPMAVKGGSLAIAVHTGLSNAEDFASLAREKRPHISVLGVKQLLKLYRSPAV